MTKDEIREFVKAAIRVYEEDYAAEDDPIDEHVEKIVERWDEDVQNRSDEAYTRGQHSIHPF